MERLLDRLGKLERRLEAFLRSLADVKRRLTGAEQRIRELPFSVPSSAAGSSAGGSGPGLVYGYVTGSPITARTGTPPAAVTLGSGTVTLYSTAAAAGTATASTATAYSGSTATIPVNALVGMIARTDGSNALDVVAEFC